MIGGPITKGPLGPVLEMCNKDDHAVFGIKPPPADAQGGQPMFILPALNDIEFLSGTVNVREKVEVDLRAKTASKEKAEQVRKKINSQLFVMKAGLLPAQLQGGEQGKQARQLVKLLGGLKITDEDADVVVTMKADADALVQLLGGSMRR